MTKNEKRVFIGIVAAVFLVIAVNAAFVTARTMEYVLRQHIDSRIAYEWAKQDLQDTVRKLLLLPTKQKEDRNDYWEADISINRNIDVVGCTSLK